MYDIRASWTIPTLTSVRFCFAFAHFAFDRFDEGHERTHGRFVEG
jgi:hypothetical protein